MLNYIGVLSQKAVFLLVFLSLMSKFNLYIDHVGKSQYSEKLMYMIHSYVIVVLVHIIENSILNSRER